MRALMVDLDARNPPPGTRMHWPSGGQAWAAALLRLLGWRLEFCGLPMQHADAAETAHEASENWVSRGVIIAYPHTSNWDGLVGFLAVWALGLKLTLWGKASLFKIPFLRAVLAAAGAVPIDRTDAQGVVAETVAAMRQSRVYWLGLAPEGTRKRLPGWRTGFYHVAMQAQVPVGLAYLDWRTKSIGVTQFLQLSGDKVADFARIERAYRGVEGCLPENASPIRPLDAQFDRREAVVNSQR